MSIQKHFVTRPYLKHANQSPVFQYRVRNLSKNQSMKQLSINNNSKKDVLTKINNKYTIDTSFFSKENINTLQVQSQQDLPKYSVENHKNAIERPIKRNASHRILRKVNSCQLLPQSVQSIPSNISLKSSFMKYEERKVSLKKKVEFIKKKHNEDKSQACQQIVQVQSEHMLAQKKRSKPKLKLLVRDPFNSSKAINERKRVQLFSESKIQPLNNDRSMLSETNREEFQQFLSCLN